ncbi:hypothetical protein ADMFC3_28060 [Geovibrio sp. ADMFC3]
MKLTAEQEKTLSAAFSEARAKQPQVKAREKTGVESWEKSDTDFATATHDAQLQFDYNKNPNEVSASDESKLRFIMQVVQQQGTNQLVTAGQDFTHDSEVWIQFFARYPLLFNFQLRESKKFSENDFTLSVNADLISTCIDAKAPEDIKNAFIQALKNSGGDALNSSTKENNLQFLTLIRSYDKASTLTIYRAQLDMKTVDVRTICGGVKKVDLKISYDRVVFEINNTLALAIYPTLVGQATDIAAQFMSTFFKQFAEKEFNRFKKWLDDLGKK